ncbi:hypothetical protein [Methylobacterium nonmethylotrophicum]|nr:hypothetical protein [Methylobacterium nonmethylotrophicum]
MADAREADATGLRLYADVVLLLVVLAMGYGAMRFNERQTRPGPAE